MSTPIRDEAVPPPEPAEQASHSQMRSAVTARFRQIASLLGEPFPEPAPSPGRIRFDQPQSMPPRPHLALTARRIWSEILNSAIGDDGDTSLFHDLASLQPQVAAAILQTVNAAQGGVTRPVQDVALAIELLGLRQLRRLATEQLGRNPSASRAEAISS